MIQKHIKKNVVKDIFTVLLISISSFFLLACSSETDESQSPSGGVLVMTWWTSGGEREAIRQVQTDVESRNVTWEEVSLDDESYSSKLNQLIENASLTAFQAQGFDISGWASQGKLSNLNSIAASEGWDTVVPEAIQKFSKYENQWVAVPFNVHSTNWVWANAELLDNLSITPPSNWNDFLSALNQVQNSGKVALAIGTESWQIATLFESVLLSTGGSTFYREALIDLDATQLDSATMISVFDRMTTLKGFIDNNSANRDWTVATQMVIDGSAAFQVMGDWAKGEFANSGKAPNSDYYCFRFPDTDGSVLFNTDQFAMNRLQQGGYGQQQLSISIMSKSVQEKFNRIKGSVPARTDISDENFDACGKKGISDFAAAGQTSTLFGSLTHGHAVSSAVQSEMVSVIANHFNGVITSAQAAQQLAAAASL